MIIMITKEEIDRINSLYKKSKIDKLNDEEKLEQQRLRQKYIDSIKLQVKSQLENVKIQKNTNDGHNENCKCHNHKN